MLARIALLMSYCHSVQQYRTSIAWFRFLMSNEWRVMTDLNDISLQACGPMAITLLVVDSFPYYVDFSEVCPRMNTS